MSDKFENEDYDVYCIDLLDNRTFKYEEAEEAYSYFMNEIGFDKAKLKVLDYISDYCSNYDEIYLLGYSVGATIAWLCSEEGNVFNGIIGYYGSRIRDYLSIKPEAPTVLFFPAKEEEFDIETIIDELKYKDSVQVYQFEGLHGFADSYSKYYDSKAKELSEKILDNFIDINW